MKKTNIFSSVLLIFSAIAFSAHAAQDYNSSRSNKSNGVDVPDITDTLLRDASAEASLVTKTMIQNDMRDGYSGDYVVTVDVRVTLQRDNKQDPVIRSIKKR